MAGIYSSDFLDILRSRTTLSQLFSQKTAIKKRGRDVFAICPFHQEKTPSCKVDDNKGFFYCFGCGSSGDAIDFARKTDNLSFQEAVEKLALNAGIEIQNNSDNPTNNSYLKSAYSLLEHATDWYHNNLMIDAGRNAIEYLATRGISVEQIKQFRLGYSPLSRGIMHNHLKRLGFDTKIQQDLGLINQNENDRFSGRIIFPINDAKGRVVGFGGRIFNEESKSNAKYINSQDSALFHKKLLLYNFHNARLGRQDLPLILCEGYMDVISLSKIDIGRVVAPLGTAVSEEQIIDCWKICPEPVVMLDGDEAGIRAVDRLIERIVPYLRPGYSLKFCILPKDEDPDSLVSSGKSNLLFDLVKNSKSMLEMLWSLHANKLVNHTPENIAVLRHNLRSTINKITDQDVRKTYEGFIFPQLNKYTVKTGFKDWPKSSSNIGKELKKIDNMELAVKILIATALNHPNILEKFDEQFTELTDKIPAMQKLCGDILIMYPKGAYTSKEMYSNLAAMGHKFDWISEDLYSLAKFARESASLEEAYNGWINVWETSFVSKKIKEEEKTFANKLKMSFSEADWIKLKTLKKCVNQNEEKESIK